MDFIFDGKTDEMAKTTLAAKTLLFDEI